MDETAARRRRRDALFPPVRTAEALAEALGEPRLRDDTCHRVRTARVVFAEYELLQADFPALRPAALARRHPELKALRGRELAAAQRRAIDRWLVDHAGIVSTRQGRQRVINEAISLDPRLIRVYRPPRYGRAVVVPVEGGLLDVKGVGVAPDIQLTRNYAHLTHVMGLVHLGEALMEYAFQQLLGAVFRHARADFFPLPIYAVIDLGFDTFKRKPAATVVRRAHLRHPGGEDFFHPAGTVRHRLPVLIEMLLRQYGLTTVGVTMDIGARGRRAWWKIGPTVVRGQSPEQVRAFLRQVAPGRSRVLLDILNLQTTAPQYGDPPAAQLIDFESFEARDRFARPPVMLIANRPFRYGGALAPSHPDAPRPRRGLALTQREWGYVIPSRPRARRLGFPAGKRAPEVELWGTELAHAYRRGELDGEVLKALLEARVREASRRWPDQRASTSAALSRALRATEALFLSFARVGPRLLELDPTPGRAALLDAAETLLAVDEVEALLRRRRAAPPAHLAWLMVRVLESGPVREARRRLGERAEGDPAARRALSAGEQLLRGQPMPPRRSRALWRIHSAAPEIRAATQSMIDRLRGAASTGKRSGGRRRGAGGARSNRKARGPRRP